MTFFNLSNNIYYYLLNGKFPNMEKLCMEKMLYF